MQVEQKRGDGKKVNYYPLSQNKAWDVLGTTNGFHFEGGSRIVLCPACPIVSLQAVTYNLDIQMGG